MLGELLREHGKAHACGSMLTLKDRLIQGTELEITELCWGRLKTFPAVPNRCFERLVLGSHHMMTNMESLSVSGLQSVHE